MVYQNHKLEMLIQWKRWLATEIHLDHSSLLRKQWSPLRQVPSRYGETSTESEPWLVTFLVKVDFSLVLFLWKDVMNLLELSDPFNRPGCTICLGPSVGGLCR
jgi:hypothetical protein